MTPNNDFKNKAIKSVIQREGGYVNHPDDRGGPTRWGVTEAVARDNGYHGHMAHYPIKLAIRVYDINYWQRLKLDRVLNYKPELATYLFDFGVNSGTYRSAITLQKVLNSLNVNGELYRDISEDGIIGKQTLDALRFYYAKRGEHGLLVLAKSINALRIAFCFDITEENPSQEQFLFGWLSRIIELNN